MSRYGGRIASEQSTSSRSAMDRISRGSPLIAPRRTSGRVLKYRPKNSFSAPISSATLGTYTSRTSPGGGHRGGGHHEQDQPCWSKRIRTNTKSSRSVDSSTSSIPTSSISSGLTSSIPPPEQQSDPGPRRHVAPPHG